MRCKAMLIRSLVVLCTMSGASFADVTVSTSNSKNAGIGAELRQLFTSERNTLNANVPSAARSANVPAIAANRLRADQLTEAQLHQMPAAKGGAEWACLTEALYFEARGEGLRGQLAVAEVILNRKEANRYPNTVCGVVNEGSHLPGRCQFSYSCDGKPERVTEPHAWARAGKIAKLMLEGMERRLTHGATHFHATYVRPNWSRVYDRTAQVGAHIFYRKPGVSRAEVAQRSSESRTQQRQLPANVQTRAQF